MSRELTARALALAGEIPAVDPMLELEKPSFKVSERSLTRSLTSIRHYTQNEQVRF